MDREAFGEIFGKYSYAIVSMKTTNHQDKNQYCSLTEIRLRKELLQKEMETDSEKIKQQWNSLFVKPKAFSKSTSPSKRISSLMSMGAGALDGMILAWKLYHKFKKK